MFILSQKLKLLESKFKVWNRDTFCNILELLRKATTNLDDIQSKIQREGHSDEMLDKEQKAQFELETTLKLKDLFWQEKSKDMRHYEGDRNTGFFFTRSLKSEIAPN